MERPLRKENGVLETATLSYEKRRRVLDLKIQELSGQKWQLESSTQTTATMVTPRGSHLLPHMILCVLTIGFWVFVAVPIELIRWAMYGNTTHHRVVIEVDEGGALALTSDRVRLG